MYGRELTVRDPGEGGDEVVLTDDGETYEHVGGHQDVEDEAAPGPGPLVQQGRGELGHGWRDAGQGRPVGLRPHLHPGHRLRLRGDGGLGEFGALIVRLSLRLLVESQQCPGWDWERDLSGLMSEYLVDLVLTVLVVGAGLG